MKNTTSHLSHQVHVTMFTNQLMLQFSDQAKQTLLPYKSPMEELEVATPINEQILVHKLGFSNIYDTMSSILKSTS